MHRLVWGGSSHFQIHARETLENSGEAALNFKGQHSGLLGLVCPEDRAGWMMPMCYLRLAVCIPLKFLC